MATILLVEDEQLLAICLAEWLKSARHQVVVAADAQAAIDALDKVMPDVVILDMLLPGANGVQVLHTLRSHADFAAIPVVICSSVVSAKLPEFEAYGIMEVVDKSTLDRRTLCAIVTKVTS